MIAGIVKLWMGQTRRKISYVDTSTYPLKLSLDVVSNIGRFLIDSTENLS